MCASFFYLSIFYADRRRLTICKQVFIERLMEAFAAAWRARSDEVFQYVNAIFKPR